MTNRERILTLLKRRQPDRVPWFGDLDYWYHSSKIKGVLPEKYLGDGYFNLNRELNIGFYLQGLGPYTAASAGVSFTDERVENRIIRTMSTPKGDLTQIQQFLPISSSWGYVKHYVETEEHLSAFRYFLQNLTYAPSYEELARRKHIVGDNGIILCYTPRSPFMEMITTYIGIQNLAYLLADVPDQMEEILELMEQKHDMAAQLSVDSPAECIMIPENLSSEVVGQYYYEKFMQPYESKWIKKIMDAGKYSFIHMDGTLKGLIRQVSRTGFDVIEAATPAPVGDMTMEEIARSISPNTIIWGGIPGIMFTPAVSDEDFCSHIKEMLDIMKKEPRFVLGVADQVPPDGTPARMAMVAELCDTYGRYD